MRMLSKSCSICCVIQQVTNEAIEKDVLHEFNYQFRRDFFFASRVNEWVLILFMNQACMS